MIKESQDDVNLGKDTKANDPNFNYLIPEESNVYVYIFNSPI